MEEKSPEDVPSSAAAASATGNGKEETTQAIHKVSFMWYNQPPDSIVIHTQSLLLLHEGGQGKFLTPYAPDRADTVDALHDYGGPCPLMIET